MKRFIALLIGFALILSMFALAESATAELQNMYAEAELKMAQGDYAGAGASFEVMGGYSDASQMAMYCKAVAAAEDLGMYDIAVMTFGQLGDFRDSTQMVTYYAARGSEAAADAVDPASADTHALEGAVSDYESAEKGYTALALFKDCMSRLAACADKRQALETRLEELDAEQKAQEEAIRAEVEAQFAAAREEEYLRAVELQEAGEYDQAISIYESLDDYKDCADRIAACQKLMKAEAKEKQYQEAVALQNDGQYQEAYLIFRKLRDHNDSRKRANELKGVLYQQALDYFSGHQYGLAKDLFELLKPYESSADYLDLCMENQNLSNYFGLLTDRKQTRAFDKKQTAINAALSYVSYQNNRFIVLNNAQLNAEIWGKFLLINAKDAYRMPFEYIFENGNMKLGGSNNGRERYSFSDGLLLHEEPPFVPLTYRVVKISQGYYAWFLRKTDNTFNEIPSYYLVKCDDSFTPVRRFATGLMEVPEEAPATEEAAPAETPAPEANRLQVFVEANIIKAAQQALNAAGYDCGTPDGVMGNNTRSSLSAYQQAQGLTVTGTPTYETLVALGVMK